MALSSWLQKSDCHPAPKKWKVSGGSMKMTYDEGSPAPTSIHQK